MVRMVRAHPSAQIELIRAKVRAYFVSRQQQLLSYGYNWKDFASEIVGLNMTGESLRQFAESQISRNRVRGISPKNLKAIISHLTDPAINALSLEELEHPDVPYRFVSNLLEFLRPDDESDLTMPPSSLAGIYRAVGRSEDAIADINLTIILSKDRKFVYLTESADLYRTTAAGDPASLSYIDRKKCFWRHQDFTGWGIVTPEDNLVGFLKHISSYSANHYYTTAASIPKFTDDKPIECLALIVSDYPYFTVDSSDKQGWFDDVCRDVSVYNVRNFIRVEEKA